MIDKYKLEQMKTVIDNVVRDIREDSQIDVLSILTQTLTKKGNVRVIFGSKTPYSNIKSNQIFLPRQIFPSDSFVDWILKKGISLHEAFHILFTGNARKNVKKLRPDSGYVYFDWNLFKMCLNSIEDVRIEFLGMNLYKGCPELLGFSLSFFHKLALIERDRMISDVLYSLSLELRGFKTLYPDRELMEKLIKVSKDVIHQDFEGCVKIALDIYDILIKDLPSQEKSEMNSARSNKSDNGIGKTQDQEFDFSGRKDKTKLSKEETKKIEKEFEEFKKEFEEMLDDDSDSDTEDEQESDEESEEKSGESEQSEEENEDGEDDDASGDSSISRPLDELMKSEDKIDKFVKIIKEKFKDEYTSQEKIERQIRMKAGDESEKLEKEFMDSDGAGLGLCIPKKGYESKFNINRANSTADMISQELKNRIIIGRTLVGDQTNGKLKLKSAVRSFVKYNIDGEFDNHIYEKELIETPEHSVILMIDCSGSMGQMDCVYDKIGNVINGKQKLSNAKETTYILGKVFETLGVKFAIRGFEGYVDFLVKKWDDELDVRRINGLMAGGGTPTAQATDVAIKKMEEVEDELKIIFTITDGVADKIIATEESVKLAREKGIHIFGIFYGQDNATYETYFKNIYGKDNFIMAKDGEELKEGVVKLYEKVLKKASYGFNGSG